MKATDITGVILAAGKGSRIDPFNSHFPKPLLPIANLPIMGHHIEIFRTLGIRKVKIVVGHLMDKIINYFGRGTEFGVEIEYVEQGETLGIAHAAGRLFDKVDGPFLMSLGDIYYAPRNINLLVDKFLAQKGGAVIAVMREDDIKRISYNFSVELDESERVRRVIEKPRHPANNLKGCGIYMFGEEIFDAIRQTPRTALRDEYEITTALQILCDSGAPVSVAEVVEWDYNITFARDLIDCNLKYLQQQKLDNLIADDAQIHADAQLTGCVVGAGARIECGVQLENCVILPGAVLRDWDTREVRQTIFSEESIFQC